MSSEPWDRRGQGPWDFTPDQYQRVVVRLAGYHVGAGAAILMRDLAGCFSDIEGRALRAILSKADATEFVLCTGDWGVYVAEYAEEVEASARRLFSQAARMNKRGRAKLLYAQVNLGRRHPLMPGFEPEVPAEGEEGDDADVY